MAVSFMDLARINKPLKEDFQQAFEECLESSDFILGQRLKDFEHEFAKALGSKHAIGVASGTDALMLTLHGLGLQPGDEVICPVFSFVATADVIVRAGATPIFVDINDDYTMDVDAVRAAVTERTKAIMPVHLFGMAAEIETLAQIAADYGLFLIEDVAQATGGKVNGRALGTFGIAGAFSFYPTKTLGGLGDGGMVVTDNDDLAERIRLFRDHGRGEGGRFYEIGYNSRLDSLQAAWLGVKLPSLDEDNADRIANAAFYHNTLSKDPAFGLPKLRDDFSHVYNLYTIRHPNRDEVRHFLSERHIQTAVYYPVPMHLQPCFEWMGYREGHFPKAELAAQQVFSLPIFPGLTRKELEEVAHNLELYAQTHPVTASA